MKMLLRTTQDDAINCLASLIYDLYSLPEAEMRKSIVGRCKYLAEIVDRESGKFKMEKVLVDIKLEKQLEDMERRIGK